MDRCLPITSRYGVFVQTLTSPLKKKQYLLVIVDCIIIFSAILLSYFFRVVFYEQKELLLIGERLSWIILSVIFMHILVFFVFELYNIDKRFLRLRGLLAITLAVSMATGLLAGLFYFFPSTSWGGWF